MGQNICRANSRATSRLLLFSLREVWGGWLRIIYMRSLLKEYRMIFRAQKFGYIWGYSSMIMSIFGEHLSINVLWIWLLPRLIILLRYFPIYAAVNRLCGNFPIVDVAIRRTDYFSIISFLLHPSCVLVDEPWEIFPLFELIELFEVLVEKKVFAMLGAQSLTRAHRLEWFLRVIERFSSKFNQRVGMESVVSWALAHSWWTSYLDVSCLVLYPQNLLKGHGSTLVLVKLSFATALAYVRWASYLHWHFGVLAISAELSFKDTNSRGCISLMMR